MGRQEVRDLGEDRQHCCRRTGSGQKSAPELPQEEDQRHLTSLIGQLPVPGACRVGAAKGALHLETQAQRVDLETLLQIGLQGLGHAEDRCGGIRGWQWGNRRKGGDDRGLKGHRKTPE